MKKKLMDLMPKIPFEGEPIAVTREPNDMEKSLLKIINYTNNETETMREAPIILPVLSGCQKS